MSEQQEQCSKASHGQCVCAGTGPAFSELLKRLGPSEPVRRHFDQARIEFLKGIRAIIDQRIQDLSRTEAKGTKLTVE